MPPLINLAYEDLVHHEILKKLISLEIRNFYIGNECSKGGRDYIKISIKKFNEAAINGLIFLVLADLDNDNCAPELIKNWLKGRSKSNKLVLRIAVKEAESWLLADKEAIADYFSLSSTHLYRLNPELIQHPKEKLIDLVKNYSRNTQLKKDFVPKNEYQKQGPAYNTRIVEFIQNKWNPRVAMVNSLSLRRAVDAIRNISSL